jgi:DNA polymerase III epsilon subunit family exonuclease
MRALVFDTETTDLIRNIGRPLKKQPRVIEYFGVTVDHATMEMGDSLSLLIHPGFQITPETTRITGITPDLLTGKPQFRDVAQQIKDHIESHDRIVAHNAGYDCDMMNIEFDRLGWDINIPEVICTIENTEHLYGYRLNLGRLHLELFGHDFTDHHRAEPDTRATARCYIELCKRGIV